MFSSYAIAFCDHRIQDDMLADLTKVCTLCFIIENEDSMFLWDGYGQFHMRHGKKSFLKKINNLLDVK